MKRPFGEVDAARLNQRGPATKVQVHQSIKCAPRRFQDALLGRALGCERVCASRFPSIARLDRLGIYSSPADIREDFEEGRIPFALSNANTCSLSAVAYESGVVRIFDHAVDARLGQRDTLRIHPHRNAIFDLQWASDDKHILTAGGDQIACLVDVQSQKVSCLLQGGHQSSIKEIKFHPLNPAICVTGGRDGRIALWDLRSNNGRTQIQWCALDGITNLASIATNTCAVMASMSGVHDQAPSPCKRANKTTSSASITAMLFKYNGDLTTASSGNSNLKTWDLRYIESTSEDFPLLSKSIARPSRATAESRLHVGSTSRHPTSNGQTRNYGVVALTQSRDGQRLYSINKDNRVYEYPASHPGASPTKIFEIPELRLQSFFCKASMSMDNFLVCGNHSGNPVLIDTERPCMSQSSEHASNGPHSAADEQENIDPRSSQATIKRVLAGHKTSASFRPDQTGRACIGGHELEVTCAAWSFDSNSFVTAGDDKCVRTWRRDPRQTGKEVFKQAHESQGAWAYL